jgi:hypothetical protein
MGQGFRDSGLGRAILPIIISALLALLMTAIVAGITFRQNAAVWAERQRSLILMQEEQNKRLAHIEDVLHRRWQEIDRRLYRLELTLQQWPHALQPPKENE